MRKVFFCMFICLAVSFIFVKVQAQAVVFKLSAPAQVIVGDQFRVVYSLNADGRDFKEPSIEGFEVLMGPMVSSGSTIAIVNGQTNIEVTLSYTYTLLATKEGRYKLPSATISSDGKKYTSNAMEVTVLPADKARSKSESTSSGGLKSGTDYFVKAHLSSSSVYQQERVLLTYKLYSLVGFSISNMKFPNFDGFFVQEIDLPQDRQMAMEHVDGRNYRTIVLKQYLLYPQNVGEITIPSARIDCVFRIKGQRQVRSLFDDFFDSYQDVERVVNTSSSTIQVKDLPSNKPASFSGAVGDLSIKSMISRDKLKTNESATITVTIAGNGNLKMVKEPSLAIPDDFESFDPKITNNFKASPSGVMGSKVIEYVFVPRHKGNYTIPSSEFSYFDTRSRSYKTIMLNAYDVVVEGDGSPISGSVSNYSNKEAVKRLGEDILYIKSGDLDLQSKGKRWFGSMQYWILMLFPIVSFALFVVFNRKRLIESRSVLLSKNKNANKMATKRLKIAMKHLKANDDRAYYTEVERAIWGYLADKLIIPVASLSKENVASILIDRGISQVRVEELFEIIDSCEMAIYSPIQKANLKNELYDKAIQWIGQIENVFIKSKVRSTTSRLSVLAWVFISISSSAWGISTPVDSLVAAAEKSYANKEYSKAIDLYCQVEQANLESSILYYNMANAYYKDKQLGKSIQYYEKALLLNPNFSEAKFNIEIAKLQCVDKIEEPPLLFFEQWILYIEHLASSQVWALASLISLLFSLCLFSLFLFGRTSVMKKVSFFASLFSIVVLIVSFTFAWRRGRIESVHETAIIGVSNVTLKSAPDSSGSNLFILHEGTQVMLLNRIGEWVEVSSLDRNIGWLKEESLLEI